MAHVVFLRGVNVGGNNVFRPAKLAAELKHLQVVNIGAAGTFVVKAKAKAVDVRKEVLARLPFKPGISVHAAREVLALVESEPFKGVAFSKDRRGWAAALDGRPKKKARLPVVVPPGRLWQVRFERVEGAFALGMWQRPQGKGFEFPSNVVEAELGVSATTRWWETLVKVAALL